LAGSPRRSRPGKAARRSIVAAALLALLVLAAVAYGHIERASYWPDPAPDASVSPPAGGTVPEARPLGTAMQSGPPGQTRVVCQPDSMGRVSSSIAHARQHGYDIRPHDHRQLDKAEAKQLHAINVDLWHRCAYHQIQPAVTVSGNNDRVVIMPGLYTEPTSRAQPTNDPACAQYKITNDKNQAGAVSYAYQFHCPNDQNLIAVIGRGLGSGTDPQPPLLDRHNIPNLGPCIRCNLQIEGSGVSADDVVIDAGRVASGNHGPSDPVKDVGIRADRADGFVLRNVTVRHAAEHGIYVIETDGYLLDRFKTFYNDEYGVLTFTADHGLMQNCEAVGSGDSGLYPGAGAEGGEQRPAGTPFRYTQQMRFCDSHHNALGYSGTDGNSVHVDHNNFYDNAMGFSTDVFTAAGHPGFPQDSDLVEHNNFYSNNFNPYVPGSDVVPTVPVPVGTGLWIAGGNNNVLRDNRFWDNWRRGVMLYAVPDAFVCDDPQVQIPGCDPAQTNTSHRNSFHDNVMGIAPNGAHEPNGLDFWWSSWPGTVGNCWYHNTSYKPITSDPAVLPDCNNGTDPSLSVGTGNAPAIAELLNCLTAIDNPDPNDPNCTWFATPPKPAP
jgi:Right handed beta helix region